MQEPHSFSPFVVALGREKTKSRPLTLEEPTTMDGAQELTETIRADRDRGFLPVRA